MMLTKLNNTTT